MESTTAERKHQDSIWTILSPYWRPLLGTARCWFFFDIAEYGLKQNDAAIFGENVSAYAESILQVLWSRLLVIPSLIFAPWVFDEDLQQKRSAHWLHRMRGGQPDLGCCLRRVAGALPPLLRVLRFQLSFQSLPGITTMAISAEIYPTMVRGTAAGISAACGKLGATVGSYVFSELKKPQRNQRNLLECPSPPQLWLRCLQPSALPTTTGARLTRLTN